MDPRLNETRESIFSVHDKNKVGCIPNNKIVAYVQTGLYFASVLLGFCVAIPIGILLRNFHGTCILFAQLVWDASFIYPYSDQSCDFVMYTAIGLCMFYALIMGIFYILLLMKRKAPKYKNTKYTPLNDWNVKFILRGMNPIMIFINALAAILVLSFAAVLTAGMDKFCGWMIEAANEHGISMEPLDACKDGEAGVNWETISIYGGPGRGVKGSNFFSCLIIAMLASWLLTAVWTLQLVMNIALTCKRCSCDIAEEKQKPDSKARMAARRSGINTPLNRTPGHMTPPVQYSQQQLMQPPPQRSFQLQQQHQPYKA